MPIPPRAEGFVMDTSAFTFGMAWQVENVASVAYSI